MHIEVSQLWEFYERNEKRLRDEMVLVAECGGGHELYISSDDGGALLTVFDGGGEVEYEEHAWDSYDCKRAANEIIEEFCDSDSDPDYLMDRIGAEAVPLSTLDSTEVTGVIADREWELQIAMAEFLMTVTNNIDGCTSAVDFLETYGNDYVKEVLDSVLDVLSCDYAIEIFRPSVIMDDETGLEMYIEEPYGA